MICSQPVTQISPENFDTCTPGSLGKEQGPAHLVCLPAASGRARASRYRCRSMRRHARAHGPGDFTATVLLEHSGQLACHFPPEAVRPSQDKYRYLHVGPGSSILHGREPLPVEALWEVGAASPGQASPGSDGSNSPNREEILGRTPAQPWHAASAKSVLRQGLPRASL